MHHGNILISSTGAKIIDWGNARIGPSMLDLANITEYDSAQFKCYTQTWQQITNRELDQELSEIGYLWAIVQINIQYLGFAVKYTSDQNVKVMLDKAKAAVRQLGDVLS